MAKSSSNSNKSGGISFLSLLAILFIALKLTNVIDWSWVWVLAPLWGGIALFLLIAFVVILVKEWVKK